MENSRIILGTAQFGQNYGIANTCGRPSDEQVAAILTTAYDAGIRLLDTAAAYGESEQVLGRVLKRLGLSGRMLLASKIPPLPPGMPPEEARRRIGGVLENSLRNLGIPTLYAVLFHREENLEYLHVLRQWQQRGALRLVGVSVDCALPPTLGDCEVVQIPANVLDRRFLKLMTERTAGLRVFARSVYLQGLLLMPEERVPGHLRAVVPLCRALGRLAQDSGMGFAELCLRYLLSFPGVEGVLTGVDTVEQLKMNLRLAEKGALPTEVLKAVREAVPELPEMIIRPSLWNR